MSAREKTIIITGANTGIGYNAAWKLADGGYDIILACRSQQNAESAIASLKETSGQDASLTFIQLDLANLSSVRQFVEDFHKTNKDLYALINNAGISYNFSDRSRNLSKNGFEMTIATNHLGHFLLTNLLLDDLKKGAEKFSLSHIVNVASGLHDKDLANNTMKRIDKGIVVTDMDLDDLMYEKEDRYSGVQAYKDSKAANIMFTYALSSKLKGTGVKVNAVCPGFIPTTGLNRHSSYGVQFFMKYIVGGIFWYFKKDVIKTVDEGGKAVSDLILSDKFVDCNGCYINNGEVKESTEETRDESTQQKLWEISENLTS